MQAEKAADALTHGCESGEGQPGPSAESQTLLDALSGALYGLAQTGLARVSQLARDPGLLACWALELLEEQACQVPPFVFPSQIQLTHVDSATCGKLFFLLEYAGGHPC